VGSAPTMADVWPTHGMSLREALVGSSLGLAPLFQRLGSPLVLWEEIQTLVMVGKESSQIYKSFQHCFQLGVASYDEFSNAVTSNNYPQPSREQYNIFAASAGPKGLINNKQEAAMALTHFLHESDGLRAKREYKCENDGCPGEYQTPGCDVPGQTYYGRGYIQLTWCFNYGPASTDLFGDGRLVTDPDIVAREETVAWDTAFWFWKVILFIYSKINLG
jgi:hypothetical protein